MTFKYTHSLNYRSERPPGCNFLPLKGGEDRSWVIFCTIKKKKKSHPLFHPVLETVIQKLTNKKKKWIKFLLTVIKVSVSKIMNLCCTFKLHLYGSLLLMWKSETPARGGKCRHSRGWLSTAPRRWHRMLVWPHSARLRSSPGRWRCFPPTLASYLRRGRKGGTRPTVSAEWTGGVCLVLQGKENGVVTFALIPLFRSPGCLSLVWVACTYAWVHETGGRVRQRSRYLPSEMVPMTHTGGHKSCFCSC